jgi:hypothetical protein
MRELVRDSQYVMTMHGQEAMEDDDLTIFDVERCFLTGRISKRQRDLQTGEWKYVVQGEALGGDDIVAVAKIGRSGRLVIVTVYLLGGEAR